MKRMLPRQASLLLTLSALALPAPAAAAELLLPCPLPASWEVVRQLELPRRAGNGEAIGGFSAAQRSRTDGSLLLLSDLPRGAISRWGGLTAKAAPITPRATERGGG